MATPQAPQGLLDALNEALQAKGAADESLAAKQASAAAVASATAADQAAAVDLDSKTTDLDNARAAFDAIADAYFRVGAVASVTP